jgi:plastocyanin
MRWTWLVIAVALGCSSAGQPQAASAPATIVIRDGRFSPDSLTVARGTIVTWTNADRVSHTVSRPLERGLQIAGPDSPELKPGETYAYTYTAVGIFDYHCRLHPDEAGSVTVTPSP